MKGSVKDMKIFVLFAVMMVSISSIVLAHQQAQNQVERICDYDTEVICYVSRTFGVSCVKVNGRTFNKGCPKKVEEAKKS